MKIVVLDGYTLNPGDLDWRPLEALGELTVHDRTEPEQVVSRSDGAEVLLTNKTIISRDHIGQLPDLKYIGVLATGYNIVNVEAAQERGIPVTNVPTYGTESVAQMVFAHLLNLTQHVGDHALAVRDGRWSGSVDFCFWNYPLLEIAGMKLGIIGLGRIGRATARLALAFGMEVQAYDVEPIESPEEVRLVDLDTLLATSDVVSLHCPLTPETEKLVDARRLALMQPHALLINTSRGPLVDEAALAEALNSERLAGAGLDVLSVEPPPSDNPLLNAKNCYITPHIAWATSAARRRLLDKVVENVRAFCQGAPQNVVNQ